MQKRIKATAIKSLQVVKQSKSNGTTVLGVIALEEADVLVETLQHSAGCGHAQSRFLAPLRSRRSACLRNRRTSFPPGQTRHGTTPASHFIRKQKNLKSFFFS